jgi:hypothetical protein
MLFGVYIYTYIHKSKVNNELLHESMKSMNCKIFTQVRAPSHGAEVATTSIQVALRASQDEV